MRKVKYPMVAAMATSVIAMMPAIASAEVQSEPAAAEAPVTNEIIVTARKRAESLQDVPVSVTALNAALLERNNITRIDQVAQLTPNTMMHSTGILPSEITAYIRGIGDRSAEPSQDLSIAISVDGVYLTNVAGSLVDTFDVQQVEVLRGPQGTLQGRNSPGGAINVTSRRPSGEFHARTQISYERFDLISLKGMVEAPIVQDVLAMKVSGFRNHGGNFMYNQQAKRRIAGGVDNWGGRVGLLFTPNDKLKAYLSADFIRDTSPDPAIRPRPHAGTVVGELSEGPPLLCTAFGFCTEFPKYENAADLIGSNSNKDGGVGLTVDYDFGPATLTSVTGYRFINQAVDLDDDGVPGTVLNVIDRKTKNRQWSQELRLASNGNGPLSYVVGVYGLHSKFDFSRRTQLGGPIAGLPASVILTAFGTRSQKTNSYAVFGQASYKITDKWSVSGGARHTWDKKDLVATPTATSGTGNFKASFSQLTVEAGTEYRFSRGNMAYFRFAQGYRAGG
ncbi:MAG: TonB-dependent receptor, partial [Alphaproteobacteria bacterium]|nr:TonB-dependent receptor [Alphaproteobacteria bacterium]